CTDAEFLFTTAGSSLLFLNDPDSVFALPRYGPVVHRWPVVFSIWIWNPCVGRQRIGYSPEAYFFWSRRNLPICGAFGAYPHRGNFADKYSLSATGPYRTDPCW